MVIKRDNPRSRLKAIAAVVLLCNCCAVHGLGGRSAAPEGEKRQFGEKLIAPCRSGRAAMENAFAWADYLVLGLMLLVSCGIGVFYGFIGSTHKTSDDFLLGGSSMSTFPMAMSLAASFVTAIELLGNPAEMYHHGTQFLAICAAFVLVVPLTSRLYLPVYMKLRLTSSYEYLSLRFSANTRYIASGAYILQMVLYTSVAVYAPALALSHATGLNVYVAIAVVYVVCIFYASQGGMKAVIIADTFQTAVLLGSLVLIVYLGQYFLGDNSLIWAQSAETGRFEFFNVDPSLTIRHSFWSVVVGGTFYWLTMFCSNQASIQKYLSVENIGQVRIALWTSCFGLIVIYCINFYTGMIMVARYRGCDPLAAGRIRASDELLPWYVLSEMGQIAGVAGFFVAGIFAASLGTVASALNSLAAVTIQDFINGALKIPLHDTKGAFWAKAISVVYGAISFALIFVVAQLGSIMQVAISFNGMVGGVTLGLFSLGMFFPWANSKGAIVGSIVAVALITTMCVGQQVHIASGSIQEANKPTSIAECPCLNATSFDRLMEDVGPPHTEIFFLYRISYIWYSAIGFLTTVCVGMFVSYLTGFENPDDVDSDLVSPPIRQFLYSLSDSMKEMLNIQHKPSANQIITLKGIINRGLDITEEVPPSLKETAINEKIKEQIRKMSAP